MKPETRSLVRHVNPDDPQGPLLDVRPDLSGRSSPQGHDRMDEKLPKSREKAKKSSKKKG